MDKIDSSDEFLAVLKTNKGIIYKVANTYCKDAEDRKDLFQEIVIKLWKAFDSYDEQFRHSTWIYRIALNMAISFYRKEKVRDRVGHPITEGLYDLPVMAETQPMETAARLLHQFISELRALDKALMLLYLEEKSHKEIAEIIGITETNVATKISRIKTYLKNRFSQTTT